MNDAMAKLREQLEDFSYWLKVQFAKLFKRPMPKDPKAASVESGDTYEVSLVPAVKIQLIKAQKIRNRVLFACIVISCVSLGVVLILFSIKSGQDIAMSRQDKRLENLSEKINSYSELDSLITIQNQLSHYDELINNRQVISRAFGALDAMLPQVGGSVQLSELRVNLDTHVITMDGQADAREDPLIDYRVLEAFKKSVGLTKYDYGRFVDAEGNEIPTQCIKESNDDGNALREGDSYYAWWDLRVPGCEAKRVGESSDSSDNDADLSFSKDAEVEMGTIQVEQEVPVNNEEDEGGGSVEGIEGIVGFEDSLEGGAEVGESNEAENQTEKVMVDKEVPVRVKIWRTPRFSDWYKNDKMSLDGVISNVEHFQSACYKYNGAEVTAGGKNSIRWSSTNDCYLAADGLTVTSSANGRDSGGNLVLRFTATATYDDTFFKFSNKHMIAIGPTRQNVTDSFAQLNDMFVKEAQDCAPDDLECLGNSANEGSEDENEKDDAKGGE